MGGIRSGASGTTAPLPAEPAVAAAAAPARPEEQVAAAIYISCAGRGGPHFGSPNAEMALISHALGDIPVVGMFAGGEIARRHIYGYTGVLTVFGA